MMENQCQWLILPSVFSTDPMLLTEVVLDNILEYVDGDSLQAGRLVNRQWNTEITRRNTLWKRTCERLGAYKQDEAFPSDTNFFHVFLNIKKVLDQMFSREAWQLGDHCDGSHCAFHKELEGHRERRYLVDTILDTRPDIRDLHRFRNKIALTPFLLILLKSSRVFLVNERMEMFPLHFPPSQQPPPQDSPASTDVVPIEDMYFERNVDLNDQQLAVTMTGKPLISFLIINTSGEILHNIIFKCDMYVKCPAPQCGYGLVCVSEGHAMAHSIHVSSSGIEAEQLWKKALPDNVSTLPCGTIMAGRKFLLCCGGTTLQVYRMDGGTFVAESPVFLRDAKWKFSSLMMNGPYVGMNAIVARVHIAERALVKHFTAEARPNVIYVTNTDWLDGLSPSTMREDLPVAVMFSPENPGGKCLRWCEGLWGNNFQPGKQKSDPASHDDI
ncbi:hypothetical protein ACOMHN_023320 [Nucella lapillus]